MPKHSFDVIVIGSGAAGFAAVESASNVGARVCLIESAKLGGECPNDACVPSKALLASARAYRAAQESKPLGVTCGSLSFQFEDVMKYRDRVVEQIAGGDRFEQLLKELGIHVVRGEAIFEDDRTIVMGPDRYEGKAIVIATGSEDFVPNIVGLNEVHYWRWRDALSKKRQVKSMAIIGGGPVACEIATFYSTFGTRVVLIESSSHILSHMDAECAEIIQEHLVAKGVQIVTNATITEILDGRGGVYGVHTDVRGEKTMHAVEQIVLAAGKRAHTNGFGLETTGVKRDASGAMVVSSFLQTNKNHIFAAGDVCNSPYRLTSAAHHEGFVAGYNAALFALGKRTPKMNVDERVVPSVVFTDPEFAHVGIVAAKAKEKFGSVLVGRASISELGRACADHTTVGMVKLVAHPKTHKILGGSIVAGRAGEMIHEIALAMYANLTTDKLASMIHAYPTYSEAVANAADNLHLE